MIGMKEIYGNIFGKSMFNGICDRLLSDPVKVGGGLEVLDQDWILATKSAFDAKK